MTAKTTGILFDINQFLSFDLDEDMKKKICFSETLLVSCMHNKKIQPPLNKNIESSAEFESEEIHGESLDEEEPPKIMTPVPSDDDFFFYFYDKKLPDKDKPTEYDNLMNINGIPTLNPNRKKVRCTCSKDNWKAVCTCGAPSEDELLPVPDVLSTSSESELSEEVDIYDRKKEKQCRCSSTGTIMDECKCGAELDKLKRKSLPKIKRITIDVPETSSTNEGSLKKGTYSLSGEKTYSLSGEGTLSLTTQSSLSVVTRSEMSDENSSPLSFTTESSLSILTPGETSKETESLVKMSEKSFTLDDFGGCLKTLITPENCTTSGGLTISVGTTGVSHDKFLVHMTSQYIADGYDSGTELLSKVDLNLHTMEENKAKYKKRKKSHEFFENELYAAICESGYFCSTTTREGDSKKQESKYISYDDAYSFVLDGSNIILLRYLALTQFEGKLTTTYLDMGGNIGESSYVSKIVPNAIVNNQEMPVLQVGRVNLSGLGYETSECYVFTLLGYLVQHQWSDSNIVVHINPLLPVDPVTNQICRQIPLRNNWQEDMQILSNYFDFKDRRLMENESYLAGKVQLQSILTDYFQTILLMKPRDVVPFTISFFASFDKSITLPHNSYFDKNCQRVRYSSL